MFNLIEVKCPWGDSMLMLMCLCSVVSNIAVERGSQQKIITDEYDYD